MIGFGLLMVWLMQPTVLPNAPFDMAEQRTPVILRVTRKRSHRTLNNPPSR